jgi:hypothetical protein
MKAVMKSGLQSEICNPGRMEYELREPHSCLIVTAQDVIVEIQTMRMLKRRRCHRCYITPSSRNMIHVVAKSEIFCIIIRCYYIW